MFDVLYLTLSAVTWAIVGYKARAWFRDRGNVDLGLTALMTAGVPVIFLFSAPRVYRAFDRLTGVANLAMVLLYSAVVLFAAGATVLLLRWTSRGDRAAHARAVARSRRAVAVLAAAWTAAIVCFALGRPDSVEHPRDFSTTYAHAPGVVAFLTLYLAIFGASLAGLGVLCPRYAATLGPSWLSRGLRTLAAGCWLGLLYCACKLAGFLLTWSGRDASWLSNYLAPMSASVAALLVLLGFSLPAVGPRAAAWRRLRRLHPLWREVTAQVPEVTIGGPRWTGRWPLADLEWRANRQMAEIRDVQRGVRRHVEPAALDIARRRADAAGLGAPRAAAVVEAAALRRGLANRFAGHLPDPHADSVVVTVGTDLAAEHEHLALVADVFHDRLVDSVLDELRTAGTARAPG
ncbi:MAB_1171c family putative transporter [Streptomyces caatingaensis]|uniref:Membrane protein n=1 Tax=Streptomyces caatingaensis TaxID=1678637 RepID=A0A0K9XLE6_9ACTN|nr:MAB_1171c family putative transporter [Streptomyces caatingaensis]KNB54234.1 membrane protein [Streptomyces caatingaensis]